MPLRTKTGAPDADRFTIHSVLRNCMLPASLPQRLLKKPYT